MAFKPCVIPSVILVLNLKIPWNYVNCLYPIDIQIYLLRFRSFGYVSRVRVPSHFGVWMSISEVFGCPGYVKSNEIWGCFFFGCVKMISAIR